VNDFANLSTFGKVRARVERLVLFFDLRGILCDILQFNIVNIIFVNCISHFKKKCYSLGGNWCRNFETLTLCP